MIEVLKQALEALYSMKETLAEHDEPTTFNEDEAIKSLRQAIDAASQLPEAEPSRSDIKQEPAAEVKAKMTGGNVGIATVIHEIYSPHREPLQPGDKLYAGYRWLGWDIEQVWSERIFGIDMRFERVQDAIKFRAKLDEATNPQPKD